MIVGTPATTPRPNLPVPLGAGPLGSRRFAPLCPVDNSSKSFVDSEVHYGRGEGLVDSPRFLVNEQSRAPRASATLHATLALHWRDIEDVHGVNVTDGAR